VPRAHQVRAEDRTERTGSQDGELHAPIRESKSNPAASGAARSAGKLRPFVAPHGAAPNRPSAPVNDAK
jgi:hypothetical protein